MKKYLRSIFLLLLTSCLTHADTQEDFGKSFMFTRPANFHIATQQAVWHNFLYNRHGTAGASIQVTPVYQQSRSISKTARYFLPFGKNELLVAGDNHVDLKCIRDVRAEWLGLPSNFEGRFSIDPKQRKTGGILEYNQAFDRFSDHALFDGYWFSIELPLIKVENNMNLTQKDVCPTATTAPSCVRECGTIDPPPLDIMQAFSQRTWRFAKIGPKKSTVQLGEIRLRFGRAYLSENKFQLVYYSGLSIPTAEKSDPEFLFSPFAGNNGHIGIIAGANVQVLLNRNLERWAFCFFVNLENILLIRNKQMRTYDLKDKPWSRYMLYNRKNGTPDEKIPGVNLLTRESQVWPYNIIDASLGWRVQAGCLEVEAAYNIWGHGNQRVRPRNKFKCDFGIAGEGSVSTPGMPDKPVTASASTINQQATNDDEFVAIRESELDLNSAAAQAALLHNFHISLGLQHHGKGKEWFFNIGFFSSYPHRNASLSRWGVWGKIGSSF